MQSNVTDDGRFALRDPRAESIRSGNETDVILAGNFDRIPIDGVHGARQFGTRRNVAGGSRAGLERPIVKGHRFSIAEVPAP